MRSLERVSDVHVDSKALKHEVLQYVWKHAGLTAIDLQEDHLYYLRLAAVHNLSLAHFKTRYVQFAEELVANNELYLARQVFEFFDEQKQYASLLLSDPNRDFTNFDTVNMAEVYGKSSEIDDALETYHTFLGSPDVNIDSTYGKVRDAKIAFTHLVQNYAIQAYSTTIKRHISISVVKALQFIESSKIYDCIVGIAHSGTPVAMAAAGALPNQPTAMVEYHRNWQSSARMYKRLSDMQALTKAERILVCDNDIVSGTTITASVNRLQQVTAAQIDVLVSPVCNSMKAEELKKVVPSVNNLVDTNDLPNAKLYSSILRYNLALQESIKRCS